MQNSYFNLINIILRYCKKSLLTSLVLGVLALCLELFIGSSVIPLVSIFFQSESDVASSSLLNWILSFLPGQHFIFPTFLILVFLSGFVKVYSLHLNCTLSQDIGKLLSLRELNLFLSTPYPSSVFISSSSLVSRCINIPSDISDGLIFSFLNLVNSVLSLLGILTILALADLKVFLTVALISLLFYLLVASKSGSLSASAGKTMVSYRKNMISLVKEAKGGYRDILHDSSQSMFIGDFANASSRYFKSIASQKFLSIYPRYPLESLFLIGILSILYAASAGLISTSFPVIILYVFGFQRALPLFQGIYSSFLILSYFSSSTASLPSLKADKQALHDNGLMQTTELMNKFTINEPTHKLIVADSVSFDYCTDTSSKPPLIKSVSFVIGEGESVALVGASGSGKSTLIDIIMGLLPPSCGQIYIRGNPLYDFQFSPSISQESRVQLVRLAGIVHVPQKPHLFACTVRDNIVPFNEEFDPERLKWALQIAGLFEYVYSLPLQDKALVGELGLNFSGGQQQRLAIARAVYRKPRLIILDESTSALDQLTEVSILENLARESISTLLVSHSPRLVELCDRKIFVNST